MAAFGVTAFVERPWWDYAKCVGLCVSACVCMSPETETWPRCPHFRGEIQGFSGNVCLSFFLFFFLSSCFCSFFFLPLLFPLSIWPYSSGGLAERAGSKLRLAGLQLVKRDARRVTGNWKSFCVSTNKINNALFLLALWQICSPKTCCFGLWFLRCVQSSCQNGSILCPSFVRYPVLCCFLQLGNKRLVVICKRVSVEPVYFGSLVVFVSRRISNSCVQHL